MGKHTESATPQFDQLFFVSLLSYPENFIKPSKKFLSNVAIIPTETQKADKETSVMAKT